MLSRSPARFTLPSSVNQRDAQFAIAARVSACGLTVALELKDGHFGKIADRFVPLVHEARYNGCQALLGKALTHGYDRSVPGEHFPSAGLDSLRD
jgi:hypothetical protein